MGRLSVAFIVLVAACGRGPKDASKDEAVPKLSAAAQIIDKRVEAVQRVFEEHQVIGARWDSDDQAVWNDLRKLVNRDVDAFREDVKYRKSVGKWYPERVGDDAYWSNGGNYSTKPR